MDEVLGWGALLLLVFLIIKIVQFVHWAQHHLVLFGLGATIVAALTAVILNWRHRRRIAKEQLERQEQELREQQREAERRRRNVQRAEEDKRVSISIGIREIDSWLSQGLSTHEIGRRFEERMAVHFRLRGATVQLTSRSGDGGCDLIIQWPDGRSGIAQCKCFNPIYKVGVDAGRDAHASKDMRKADYAMVITNSHLNKQATSEAKLLGLEVWDREKLIQEFDKINKDILGEKSAEMALSQEREGLIVRISSRGF